MSMTLAEARVSNSYDPMLTITPVNRRRREPLDVVWMRRWVGHGHRKVRQEVGWSASVDGLGNLKGGDEGQEAQT